MKIPILAILSAATWAASPVTAEELCLKTIRCMETHSPGASVRDSGDAYCDALDQLPDEIKLRAKYVKDGKSVTATLETWQTGGPSTAEDCETLYEGKSRRVSKARRACQELKEDYEFRYDFCG